MEGIDQEKEDLNIFLDVMSLRSNGVGSSFAGARPRSGHSAVYVEGTLTFDLGARARDDLPRGRRLTSTTGGGHASKTNAGSASHPHTKRPICRDWRWWVGADANMDEWGGPNPRASAQLPTASASRHSDSPGVQVARHQRANRPTELLPAEEGGAGQPAARTSECAHPHPADEPVTAPLSAWSVSSRCSVA